MFNTKLYTSFPQTNDGPLAIALKRANDDGMSTRESQRERERERERERDWMQAHLSFTKTQTFHQALSDGIRNWFAAVTTNLIGQYLTSDGSVVFLCPVPPSPQSQCWNAFILIDFVLISFPGPGAALSQP